MSWYTSAVKCLSRSFQSSNAALNGGRRGITRIAIVGSGPAGFYTAHHLIKVVNVGFFKIIIIIKLSNVMMFMWIYLRLFLFLSV